MAVTITQSPSDWQNTGNPLRFTFSSNQTAQPNFSFIVETRLDNILISTDKVFIENSTRAHWDASGIVNDFINSPRIITPIFQASGISGILQVKIYENYGVIPVNQGTVTSSNIRVFNCSLSDYDWVNTNFATTYKDKKFLTDTPNNTFYITRTQDVPTTMIYSFTFKILISCFNSNGDVIDYVEVDSLGAFNIVDFNFSASNLTAAGITDIGSVAYFKIQIEDSEVYTFIYVEDECAQPYSLVWMNKFGAFDTYPVTHNLEEDSSVEISSYKKQFGGWNGVNYSYNAQDSGDVDFKKITTEKGKLTTGYMTQEIQNWFTQIYDSPRVFLYGKNGLMFPLKITNRGYSKKQGRFEELINESITFEKSISYKSITL